MNVNTNTEKILIIEDDNDINNLVAKALKSYGYECMQAFSGTEGLLHFKMDKFSLVIMDLMLPGMNGEELIREIRNMSLTPVIVMSAKDGLDSKLELLEAGAEDYITKPFEIDELVARVKVQLRRFGMDKSDKNISELKHKSLVLDLTGMTAQVNGNDVNLTKQEFKIIELLMKNPNRVFSKQNIYDYAWDDMYMGEDKTLNMHISNIRKKLKAVCEEEYIETVWGIGFKLSK